jgi:hypothetical protein
VTGRWALLRELQSRAGDAAWACTDARMSAEKLAATADDVELQFALGTRDRPEADMTRWIEALAALGYSKAEDAFFIA